jgi:hypothetical protein
MQAELEELTVGRKEAWKTENPAQEYRTIKEHEDYLKESQRKILKSKEERGVALERLMKAQGNLEWWQKQVKETVSQYQEELLAQSHGW